MPKSKVHKITTQSISKLIAEKKLILLLLGILFLLRFPSLFEPLLNDRETYLITYASGLLPKESFVSFLELPLVLFAKLAFSIFGTTFWSVKFLLLLYFSATVYLIYWFLEKFLDFRKLALTTFLFILIFGLPCSGSNQLNLSLLLPPLILSVFIFNNFHKFLSKKTSHYLLLLPFICIAFLFLTKTTAQIKLGYYPNFINYSFSNLRNDSTAEENYFAFFDGNINQSYSLAFFVKQKTTTNDFIFIVGKETSIYFLANRKAASVNILVSGKQRIDETLTDIETNKPTYILYNKEIGEFGKLDRLLNKSYNLSAQENNVKIYSFKPS